MVEFLSADCDCCNAQATSITIAGPTPFLLRKYDNDGVFQWKAFLGDLPADGDANPKFSMDLDILSSVDNNLSSEILILASMENPSAGVNSLKIFKEDGSSYTPWKEPPSEGGGNGRATTGKRSEVVVGITSAKFSAPSTGNWIVAFTNAIPFVGGTAELLFDTISGGSVIDEIATWDGAISGGNTLRARGRIFITQVNTDVTFTANQVLVTGSDLDDTLAVRLSSATVLSEWLTSNPDSLVEEGRSITEDPSTGKIYVGTRKGDLVRLTVDLLTEEWINITDLNDPIEQIVLDSSGDLIVVSGNKVFKFSSVDGSLTSTIFDHGSPLKDITIDSSDNLYICGETNLSDNASIRKLSSAGTQIWKQSIDFEAAGVIARAIKLDENDNVYVGHDTNNFY